MGVVKLSDYRPPLEVVEHRVAQLEDGFTRIANELLDAAMASGLSETELCVLLAVWRKTYGYSKKMDWISNEQLEAMVAKHHTHCSTAKNLLISKKVLVQEGRKVGMNTSVSEWKTKINGFCKTLAKPAKKTLAEGASETKQKLLTTKDNIQKIKDKTPHTPQGDEALALECLEHFNTKTGSRCQATGSFLKALTTVKAKGECYTADEVKLVIDWAAVKWGFKAKPENIFRMTRFDGYLSSALQWRDGEGQNPLECPHDKLIAAWNCKFPDKSIAPQEWKKSRPAFRNLEAVWNGKTNQGNWREVKHVEQAFDLIAKSTLFADATNKSWLTLDWILNPKNWGQVYEQAINEHKQRKGIHA